MDFSSRKGLRSALRPFVGISMHVAAFPDFQRTAICSPNAREMRLRCPAVRARKATFIIAMAFGRRLDPVRPISEDTRIALFTTSQTFEIHTISPHTLGDALATI